MKSNYLLKHILGTSVFFVVIFISAGKINYWQGLVYMAIGIVMFVLNYTVLCVDEDLRLERSKPGEGTKKWDKVLLLVMFVSTVAMYITAGLDSGRFHWSPKFPLVLPLAGIIFTITGQLLFLIAQKQNRFFSSTIRIQTDRNHVVCDTGLYGIVRHPAYLGSITQSVGFPLLFCSLWSIIPAGLAVALIIIRTYLEDKTLQNELPGYAGYSAATRFRLIPGIW